MDFSKNTELSVPVIDVNTDCSFDGCRDLDKPVGYLKEKEVQKQCVDLNIEGPSSSFIIKELICRSSTSNAACFSSSTSSALEKFDKDKMVIDCESLGTSIPSSNSTNHPLELSCPPRTPTENSSPASIATKKLFGVDMTKPSSSQSDQVTRATILRHVVEPLDYGTVMIGKDWCNHQAIFPKGTCTQYCNEYFHGA
jgi:histone demethylase JARID1